MIEMGVQFAEYAFVMKALADETRLRILYTLMDGEQCACRILERFDISQPTLSHHMKMLEGSGLVRSRRDGLWKRYRLEPSRMGELLKFLSEISESPDKAGSCEGGCGR
ncbi:MAG TPA: metalloregulator ArsR/SmtB family transcription factor [Bacillota bacterium]|nr:metalloregulator ArsR/SmtB family transcription factor [Bacillota bacterium]